MLEDGELQTRRDGGREEGGVYILLGLLLSAHTGLLPDPEISPKAEGRTIGREGSGGFQDSRGSSRRRSRVAVAHTRVRAGEGQRGDSGQA